VSAPQLRRKKYIERIVVLLIVQDIMEYLTHSSDELFEKDIFCSTFV